MNYWKDKICEEMIQGFDTPPDKMVSAGLFPYSFIKNYIRKNGKSGLCSYTGKKSNVVHLKKIVILIRDTINDYYGDPDDEGVGFDSGFEEDAPGITSYNGYILFGDRKLLTGEELFSAEEFWTYDDKLSEDIIECFKYCRWVYHDPYGNTESEEMESQWQKFCGKTMKESANGMSIQDMVKSNLNVLRKVATIVKSNKKFLIDSLNKGCLIYRCVKYSTRLKKICLSKLASPPVQYATIPNRMSPAGVSMFYGSMDKQTPLDEAQNGSGNKYAYLGEFEFVKEIRVLNLVDIPRRPTIFDKSDYWGIRFLHEFTKEVSKPISNRNTMEYVPTQVMTEFFRYNIKPSINGIVYMSSKNRTKCCVLFLDNAQCTDYMALKSHSLTI